MNRGVGRMRTFATDPRASLETRGPSGARLEITAGGPRRSPGVRAIHRRLRRRRFQSPGVSDRSGFRVANTFPAWRAFGTSIQTDHVDPRRTPCFRVGFYPDHRSVGYHPANPTRRVILLFVKSNEIAQGRSTRHRSMFYIGLR